MLQLAEQCNFPDLLAKEFTVYAQAYDGIVKQKNYSQITTTTEYIVGVTNSEQDLSLTGNTRILDNLKKNAPQLEPKNLSKLTEAKLTQFFFLARTYMLESSIPWDSFSDYFLHLGIQFVSCFGWMSERMKVWRCISHVFTSINKNMILWD